MSPPKVVRHRARPQIDGFFVGVKHKIFVLWALEGFLNSFTPTKTLQLPEAVFDAFG